MKEKRKQGSVYGEVVRVKKIGISNDLCKKLLA
jgi:hypothetical protein